MNGEVLHCEDKQQWPIEFIVIGSSAQFPVSMSSRLFYSLETGSRALASTFVLSALCTEQKAGKHLSSWMDGHRIQRDKEKGTASPGHPRDHSSIYLHLQLAVEEIACRVLQDLSHISTVASPVVGIILPALDHCIEVSTIHSSNVHTVVAE